MASEEGRNTPGFFMRAVQHCSNSLAEGVVKSTKFLIENRRRMIQQPQEETNNSNNIQEEEYQNFEKFCIERLPVWNSLLDQLIEQKKESIAFYDKLIGDFEKRCNEKYNMFVFLCIVTALGLTYQLVWAPHNPRGNNNNGGNNSGNNNDDDYH